MEFRDRVRLDRYAIKNPDAVLKVGDMVVASMQRKFDRTGRPVESREIGWVQSVHPDDTYDVKLDTDGTVEQGFPRDRLDYVVETTYADICHRVATAVSTIEKKKDRAKFAKAVEAAMVAERFVPAGRILSGLGRPGYDLTLFNCYVFNITQDSRRGITEHWGRLFETYSRGGGVGTPLSVLRPKGTVVRKVNGRSSGSISWAEQFSQITGAVEQGGSRRGASMLCQWCWHPDVLELIDVKALREEITLPDGKTFSLSKNLLCNANVSIMLTEGFMQAVQQDSDWDLVFPDTDAPGYDAQWNGDIWRWRDELKKPVVVYRTIKARELWNRIIQRAWESGEPGIIFMERANQMSNSWYYAPLIGTNPCVTGDTLVATANGYTKASKLKPGMEIMTPKGLRPIKKVYNNGKQIIYRVRFSDGGVLNATADHKLRVVRNKKFEWVPVSELRYGDDEVADKVSIIPNTNCFGPKSKLPEKALAYIKKRNLNVPSEYTREMGLIIGTVIGDGCFRKNKSGNSHSYVTTVAFGRSERNNWMKLFLRLMKNYKIHTHTQVNEKEVLYKNGVSKLHVSIAITPYMLGTLLANLDFPHNVKSPQKYIPQHMMRLDKNFTAGLLDGLFSTDGSVSVKQDNPLLRFHTSSKVLAQQVRLLLLQFGIHGRIYKSATDPDRMYDGRCMAGTGVKYDLLIMNEGIAQFYREIGLSHHKKAKRLKDIANNWHFCEGAWTASVQSITKLKKKHNVYDVYEPDTLVWVTNGYTSLDCSEQVLPDNAVCNLAHLNLGRYVTKTKLPITTAQIVDQAIQAFDWGTLEADVQLGVRFLDNINDLNVYHDDAVKKQQLSERRVGLGILGYGDALMRLGLRYGSNDAIAFTDKLMRTFTTTAYKASVQLAKKRGAFPKFQAEHFLNSGFMKQMPKDVRVLVKEHGIRNVTCTTIAPTGSTSVLMNTSTGCEPFFDFQYTSTTRIGIVHEQAGVVDLLCQQFGQDKTKWPEYAVTAQQGITPEQHVKTQATMQRWIDSALSKCIAAGTLIPTNKGLIAVEAFADTHKVDTFVPTDGKFKTSGHRILSHYRAGKKAATMIRLDNGAELVGATESHRVLTSVGWRRMANLKPGDLVVCRLQESHGKGGMPLGWADKMRSNANKIKTPKRMTPAFAEFLGMLAADGHTIETTGCVGLTCKNDRVAANFHKLCRKIFGVTPKETTDKRTGVLHIYMTSRNLVRFVESIIGKGAYNKHAPTAVLQGNYEEKLAFLTGITLDGCATPQGLTIYEGMSKDLAYHVAEIARSFGLPYVYQSNKWVAATKAYAHGVTVSNELQEIIIPIELHKRKTATYKRLKVLADVHNMARSAFYSRSTEYYALRTAQYRNNNYMFNTTAKALGISADILVHKVTKVEDAGIVEMYDIEVEDAHEYVVNGMVSHNTINLPNSATVKDVADAYMLMWELGCKGGTVYRDGSRDVQVLYTNQPDVPKSVEVEIVEESPATAIVRPRPDMGASLTFSEESPIGTIHLTIRHDPESGEPVDMFVTTGKGDASADGEALGRLMSMILRFPNNAKVAQTTRMELIRDQLIDILGRGQVGLGPNAKRSLPDTIAKIINRYLEADHPLANLPMGVQQMEYLFEQLRSYGGDKDKIDQLYRFVVKGDPRHEEPNGLTYQQEIEAEVQKAETGGIKLPYDYCPDCGNFTLVMVPGKCPVCRTCGYTRC